MPLRLRRFAPLPRAAAILAVILLAIIAFACDDASGGQRTPAAGDAVAFEEGLPVVMSVRPVCRLISDSPNASASGITGSDGSQSVVAGGRAYWFFGDTVRRAGTRQDVVPAAVATTTDDDARDCLDLQFKTANGEVEPMFPRREETTAWPDGVLALDDGSIVFYMVKAVRTSPFDWHVSSVGLGRIPAGSVSGERVVETIWDEHSGFGARVAGVRSPVRAGDDVIVYLRAEDNKNYVAKAPLARMGEFAAYTYWDGDGWTTEPAKAQPMWPAEAEYGIPPDNGVQVSFDERSGKWMALYNDRMAITRVRLADQPWGPWSEPVTWFDCRPLVQDSYPYCYTGELHRELTRDGGLTQYMTISSQKPYDVTLVELHMGQAVHAWRSGDGARRYAFASPGEGYSDEGVAFYASPVAAPGLAPVFEAASGAGYDYRLTPPDAAATPAFYAYGTASATAVTLAAVHAVDDGGRLVVGAGDGAARFYVPCPVKGCEESSGEE